MLYFYKSISPQPIEQLNSWLDYFFQQMFAEVSQTYDPAIHIHADFRPLVRHYKAQLNNRLADIFSAYMDLKNPADKLAIQSAYTNNTNIRGICNGTVVPVKYNALPPSFSAVLEELYDNLWGESKILGLTEVEKVCGSVKVHFNNLMAKMEERVCPFCGLESLLCEHDDGRDDYDHYLPKADYPFIAVNFANLFPMCHRCNSKAKGSYDIPYDRISGTQRPVYYPLDTTKGHSITLSINSATTHLKETSGWDLEVTCEPATSDGKKKAWMDIFNIETRYKAVIAAESYTWKGWIVDQHSLLCKKGGLSFSIFRESQLDRFKEPLKIDKGILFNTFYRFILDAPNCEANLNGQILI